ncbi:MAG: tetratricopeptide (TPR) repeat protein [Paraglaciecola sp.]|jgi:tetratricopeptide (TPR) repeat protein
MGHDGKANDIVDRVTRKRSDNPFFYIKMGDKAFEKQQWKVALKHYRQALKLDKSTHEVFFGLGKTYFELGNIKRSYHYLKLAKKKSKTEQKQNVY